MVLTGHALHLPLQHQGCQAPYLPHSDVPELGGQGEHPKELDFTEGGFQELVVGLHGLVGDVVVAGDAAELCHLPKDKSHSEAAERHRLMAQRGGEEELG